MNNAAPKLQPLKATPPKTMGTQGQGLKPPKPPGINQGQPGGPPRGNAELVLMPSKTNPAIKRWQNPHEEQPEPKQPKAQDQPTGKAPKQADRPDFQVGDRIAFQTKDQHGSSDFTYGKIQEESDTFYGVIDDNGDKHSLPKQAARTPKQVTESKAEEKETAEKEGREVKSSKPRSKEVDIKAGDKVEKGLLLENGDLWQAVNVGSYVDYVKLGNIHNNATVAMKVGSHLGVVNEDGKSDVIHKSDVINVGKGTNREQVDQFNKRLLKNLKKVEKKLDKYHLENKSLRKQLKKIADKKGTTVEAEEKLNQQIVKEREKRKAVEQKLHDLTIKHALKEERRLRDLASLQQQLKEQKKVKGDTEKTATEEKKTRLDRIINKYETQIKDLEDRLEFQARMQKLDALDKEKLIDIETGRVDYKKQLKAFQNEMQNLIQQDYDYALAMKNEKKVKKAKYDFSNIDFDQIDSQHAMDVMLANEMPTAGASRKEKDKYAKKVEEARGLFKKNPAAFFQRMLNKAKRSYPDGDDLTALQQMYGTFMLSGATDENWISRVQVLKEGDQEMYDAFGPDDSEIEKELESRNQPVINRAIEDLGLSEQSLASIKAGSPQYEKLVDRMTDLLLAHGQTRAELANEYLKPRTQEGEQPSEPSATGEAPEALYDPEEPYYPQQSDYDSLDWHDDSANEFADLMSKDEAEFFHKLERDESGNFKPEFIETFIEDNPEMTAQDYQEMEPILNAVYAESNKGYEQERVAQAHSEVMATAQIITDRIIKKAGMKTKAQSEVEKLKEKVTAKEREFLDKYLYGIKKAFTWFGRLITMKKSQQSLSLDAPAKMPRYVRATVTRQPLHHIEHGDKALLPSDKNPNVRRWKLINPDEKKEKTLSLFDQPEKEEKKKEIAYDVYKPDGGWWDFAETVAMEHAKVIKQTHSNETVLRPRPETVRKIAQNLGISQTDVDRGLTIFSAPDTKYEIAHHRKTKPDAPKIEAKPPEKKESLFSLSAGSQKDLEKITQKLDKTGIKYSVTERESAGKFARPGAKAYLIEFFDKDNARQAAKMFSDKMPEWLEEKHSPQQKQPWEMTGKEFFKLFESDQDNYSKIIHSYLERYPDIFENTYGTPTSKHRRIVQQALKDGKSVPKEVLADYPELQEKEAPKKKDNKKEKKSLYFTVKKAKDAIMYPGQLEAMPDDKLQAHIVKLLDYNRYVDDTRLYLDILIDGGYFKNATSSSSQGLSPVEISLQTNLKTALNWAIEEREKRKKIDLENKRKYKVPDVLYHGTTQNFRQLDSSKAGSHIPDFMSLLGTHYTPNKEVAQQFAGKQGKVIESDFKPKKPFKTTESDLVRQIATFGVENGMIDMDRAKESAQFHDVKAKLGSKQDMLNFIKQASYKDLRQVIYPQVGKQQGQKIVDAYAEKHLKDYDSIQYLNEVEKADEKRYDWIELKQVKKAIIFKGKKYFLKAA